MKSSADFAAKFAQSSLVMIRVVQHTSYRDSLFSRELQIKATFAFALFR
jgi:hypothetical protein